MLWQILLLRLGKLLGVILLPHIQHKTDIETPGIYKQIGMVRFKTYTLKTEFRVKMYCMINIKNGTKTSNLNEKNASKYKL